MKLHWMRMERKNLVKRVEKTTVAMCPQQHIPSAQFSAHYWIVFHTSDMSPEKKRNRWWTHDIVANNNQNVFNIRGSLRALLFHFELKMVSHVLSDVDTRKYIISVEALDECFIKRTLAEIAQTYLPLVRFSFDWIASYLLSISRQLKSQHFKPKKLHFYRIPDKTMAKSYTCVLDMMDAERHLLNLADWTICFW